MAALALGVAAALGLAAALGESPWRVLELLLQGSLGSATGRGYSLFYATPLIFTGLSVAWAFRAGLFNIGAEGQMTLGGVAMAAVGILAPGLPAPLALPLALAAGFLTGGAWAAIAGWFKAKRGCHEVLSTILLNFVAYGLAAFFIVSSLKNPDSQAPETLAVGDGYRISPIPGIRETFGGASPLNWSLLLALAAAGAFWLVFARSRFGFVQRLAGAAPGTALRAGICLDRERIKAMFIAGGLAGLGGSAVILGFAGKAREGFAAGAGFVGVAVALLGGNSAFGVVLAALFFGCLAKGSLNLEIDADYITRDLATVIQGLVVLAVASRKGLAGLCRFLARALAARWLLARARRGTR
jgi:simple sugar transport system permease protein